MTTLAVVRHGQTDWNLHRRIQGSTDIPLNETGRAQARAAAEELRAILAAEPVLVYSSALSRARETAQIIAEELGAPAPRVHRDLRERMYGDAEGADVESFLAQWGDWHTARIPGAESWEHVRARAVRALRAVARDVRRTTAPAAATAVVVSHGGVIRELLGHATGGERPAPGERLENGSVHRFLLEREGIRMTPRVRAGA